MCLSKDSRVARDDTPDLDIPMNAAPKFDDLSLPDNLRKYFTLDKDFKHVPGVSLTFKSLFCNRSNFFRENSLVKAVKMKKLIMK